VSGNLWAAELTAGRTIDEVDDRLDGDVLGDDPLGAYDASATAAAAAFELPSTLDAPCAVSYGPVPGSVYAGHRFVDVLIHGWDVGIATGQDPRSMPASSRRASRSSNRTPTCCAPAAASVATSAPVANLDAGQFEPRCPVCGSDLVPGLVPEDAPLDPRSTYMRAGESGVADRGRRVTTERVGLTRMRSLVEAPLSIRRGWLATRGSPPRSRPVGHLLGGRHVEWSVTDVIRPGIDEL
jgi:uncharacterized protein (TIGR03086 family)